MMKPIERKATGALAVAQAHARACWDRTIEHAEAGRCTCHIDMDGSVHTFHGCVTGRMLSEEYWIAADRVVSLSPKLEFGDFEKPLENHGVAVP